MKCPKCLKPDSKVMDSRTIEDDFAIRRRRVCDKCDFRFTTYERIETANLVVIKKDSTREPYSKQKLEAGIWRACAKRPVTKEDIESLIQDLETNWVVLKEIPTKTIGDEVMEKLRDIDEIAYVRFASVYKDFKTADEFKKIVEKK